MKTNAVVNVGLLLDAMLRKNFTSINDASASCGVDSGTLNRLLAGELPRFDALGRILRGFNITAKELFIVCPQEKEKQTESN